MADIKAMNAAAAYGNAANITDPGASFSATPAAQNIGPDFSEFLGKSLNDVMGNLQQAETHTVSSLTGKATLDDVALSLTNAELSVKTLLGIRDRVINAYQDIIKMPM